jgi:hypothetical protein
MKLTADEIFRLAEAGVLGHKTELIEGRFTWDTGWGVGFAPAQRLAAAELGIELPPDEDIPVEEVRARLEQVREAQKLSALWKAYWEEKQRLAEAEQAGTTDPQTLRREREAWEREGEELWALKRAELAPHIRHLDPNAAKAADEPPGGS